MAPACAVAHLREQGGGAVGYGRAGQGSEKIGKAGQDSKVSVAAVAEEGFACMCPPSAKEFPRTPMTTGRDREVAARAQKPGCGGSPLGGGDGTGGGGRSSPRNAVYPGIRWALQVSPAAGQSHHPSMSPNENPAPHLQEQRGGLTPTASTLDCQLTRHNRGFAETARAHLQQRWSSGDCGERDFERNHRRLRTRQRSSRGQIRSRRRRGTHDSRKTSSSGERPAYTCMVQTSTFSSPHRRTPRPCTLLSALSMILTLLGPHFERVKTNS